MPLDPNNFPKNLRAAVAEKFKEEK